MPASAELSSVASSFSASYHRPICRCVNAVVNESRSPANAPAAHSKKKIRAIQDRIVAERIETQCRSCQRSFRAFNSGMNPLQTRVMHDQLKAAIRDVPDFPIKGILFKDITPVLQDGILFRHAVDAIANRHKSRKIDAVV